MSLYLIFDGKSGFYWRPESKGYGNLQHAGIYSKSEAKRIASNTASDRNDLAIPLESKKAEIEELFGNAARLMRALI